MCEWKEFCESGDKGDDCADPDFQNGCEQYWGFSRMDDDRFRREMTARREATKAGKKNLAEKLKKAINEKATIDLDRPTLVSFSEVVSIIDDVLSKDSGGNQQ